MKYERPAIDAVKWSTVHRAVLNGAVTGHHLG